MPKVQITEVDNTGAIQLDSTSNVVYISGLASGSAKEPKLFDSLAKFKEEEGYVDDGSYKLAKRLLQLGMQVLYEGVTASSAEYADVSRVTNIVEVEEENKKYFKVLGSDVEFEITNNAVTYKLTEQSAEVSVDIVDGVATFADIDTIIKSATFDFISNKVSYVQSVVVSGSIGTINWDRLEDPNAYNIRFLTTGVYACPSDDMVKCAEHRGDCVALIDHAKNVQTVAGVKEAIEGIVTHVHPESGSSFCAGFTPWIQVRLNIEDENEITSLPGSAGFLLAYARSVSSNPTWYATAGSFRGVIPGFYKTEVEYSKSDCDALQNRTDDINDHADNVGIAINPIANIRPFGVIVFGNRTLIASENTLKATAFLNVRNLVSTLKKELYFASNKYTFEQNNEVLWINFKSQITPLLDRMQSGNGIEGYRLARLTTDKKARLKARVTIVPIEAVEDFELEVSLEDSLEVVEE